MRRHPTTFALPAVLLAFAAAPAGAADLRGLCAASARDGDVVVCERAVAQYPDDPAPRRNYARALYVSGRYDAAIEQYREAVARSPNDAQAQLELAGSLASLRRYGEAVEPIQAAMRLEPGNIMIYRVASIVYRQMGWPALALDANRKAADLGDLLAVYELSQMYSLGIGVERNPGEAMKWLERAGETGHVAAMDQLARVYRQGELDQAADPAKADYWARKANEARRPPG